VGAVSTALVVLETQDLAAAARTLRLWVGEPVESRVIALSRELEECAGMAGSDPGGTAWAASYDRAATVALQAAADSADAVDRLAQMFAQTARNYEAADAASTADERRLVEAATASLPRFGSSFGLPVCVPPSAAGGSGGGPPGWGLVSGLVGTVWPNGHQDRLRAAAAAWTASADALRRGADDTVSAARLAISDQLPEAADMWTVCHSLGDQLHSLADVHGKLGAACEALAHHLDEVHAAVEGELSSLLEWTGAIQAAGGLISVFTLGTAEAPTQAVEAARVGATASRVAQLIERFAGLARALAQSTAPITDRAMEVSARIRLFLDAKLTEAAVTVVQRYRMVRLSGDAGAIGRIGDEAEGFPSLHLTAEGLEGKFKHAAAFGVATPRGKQGFEDFRMALEDFVRRRSTVRIFGKLRGQRAILNYDVRSRLVLVQKPDGEFWTAWEMTPKQLWYVMERGVLGSD
jgi:hypothetical protein